MELHRDVGLRRINVLIYKGYDLRLARSDDRVKERQTWICPHAKKFNNCRARLKLEVRDLLNIIPGATVVDFVEHNHDPKVMNSYGLAVERTLPDTPTDVEGAANFDHATPSQHGTTSLHAISRLSARDFKDDFADARLQG